MTVTCHPSGTYLSVEGSANEEGAKMIGKPWLSLNNSINNFALEYISKGGNTINNIIIFNDV